MLYKGRKNKQTKQTNKQETNPTQPNENCSKDAFLRAQELSILLHKKVDREARQVG